MAKEKPSKANVLSSTSDGSGRKTKVFGKQTRNDDAKGNAKGGKKK